MEAMQIIILATALLIIGFIVWWFFGKHQTSHAESSVDDNGSQQVSVTVNGGYTPNTVVLKKDIPAQIVFDRKDPSNCFDEVILPDFGVQQKLPVNQTQAIEIDTSKPGEYQYSCGMNMFHGKVIIK